MMNVADRRRKNLRRLVVDHGGMNALARRLGFTKGAYISQLLVDPPVRVMSEKTARGWERRLNLHAGWMDADPGALVAAPPNGSVGPDLLRDVVKAVLDALGVAEPLSPAEVAELISVEYADAILLRRVDSEKIRRIVALIRR